MNRIHKAKHRNTRKRRMSSAVLALFLLLGCIFYPNMEVRADSLSVRASASSVKIGDTVTISITVPAGVSATVNLTYPGNLFAFQSASETANSNGGTVSMTLGGYGGTDTATTGTVTFKAQAAGNATFSASAPVAGNQEGDQVSIGSGSASVTVQNEAGSSSGSGGSGGNANGGSSSGRDDDDDDGDENNSGSSDNNEDGNRNKSADNSLSSLKLSAGKLSPSFQYNVVNYTATVDYSVTSVVVSASVSNANAKIESVKGGENLAVGGNRIQIVVKAENGVTATYTVTVTRKAQDESDDPQDQEEPEEPGEPDEPDIPQEPDDDLQEPAEQSFVVGGRALYPSVTIPDGLKADGFEPGETTLWNQTFPAYVDTFAGGTLQLVWLVDENGENGDLYLVLSNNRTEAYDYVCLHAEKGFIVILPDGDGSVPEAYAAMPAVYDLDEYGTIDAWFLESSREFALVYAVNQLGERGWYMLDTLSCSYVRYQEPSAPVLAEEPVPSTEEEPAPASDDGELSKLRTRNHLIIGAAVIAVLILFTILILVTVLKRSREDEDEEAYGEDYDLWSEDDPVSDLSAGMDQKEGPQEGIADEFLAAGAGLAGEEEKEMAADISRIADPAPMQTVATHKDQDDDDLEFIDL